MGLGDVGGEDLGGVGLASAAHAADYGKAEGVGVEEEEDFGREGVDAIDNAVVGVGVEELDGAVVAEKFLQGGDVAVGVDVEEAVAKEECFRLADGGAEGDELAVEVGGAHGVAVDEGETSHAGTAQLLGGIAPYSAKADNKDMGGLEPLDALLAKEQLGSGAERGGHLSMFSCISISSIIIQGLRPLARCHSGIWASGRATTRTKRTLGILTGTVTTWSWVVFMAWSAGL